MSSRRFTSSFTGKLLIERGAASRRLHADSPVPSIRLNITRRATGRTLPHCYLEMASLQIANDVILAMDRKQLGDRTVRIKWERRGELMRDVRCFGSSDTGPIVPTDSIRLFSRSAFLSRRLLCLAGAFARRRSSSSRSYQIRPPSSHSHLDRPPTASKLLSTLRE